MYNKSRKIDLAENAQAAEQLVDILYEMGKDMLVREKDYGASITWLDRALEIIQIPEPNKLSRDAGELRISVLQASIKARIGIGTAEKVLKARDLLQRLEDEIGGDRLVVQLLKLELNSSIGDELPNPQEYYSVLKRMMAGLELSDDNFKLIMFHIRKLQQWTPPLACAALEAFLLGRMTVEPKHAQVEKILITRFYMNGDDDSQDAVSSLERFMDCIATCISQPLTAGASLGVHTVSL